MNALHIILNSARLLEDSELTSNENVLAMEQATLPYLTDETVTTEATEAGLITAFPRLGIYLSALNFVVSELAQSYYRVPASLTISTTSCAFDMTTIGNVSKIVSITDLNGNEVDYSITASGSIVFDKEGSYILNCYQIPHVKSITSGLGYFADRVDYNLLSYGVCANYCLMTGRYEMFNAFDQIYRSRLPVKLGGRVFSMPARRWV